MYDITVMNLVEKVNLSRIRAAAEVIDVSQPEI